MTADGTPVERHRGRRASKGKDVVTLRVPRRIREAIRRIAAFEEQTMEAITLRAIEEFIAAWEKQTGMTSLRKGASAMRRKAPMENT